MKEWKSLDEIVEDIDVKIKVCQENLEKVDIIVKKELDNLFLILPKSTVFIKCLDCNEVGTTTRYRFKKHHNCPYCKSNNIIKISKDEFIKLYKEKKYKDIKRRIIFYKFLKEVVPKLGKKYFKWNLGLHFGVYDRIDLFPKDIRIFYHYFDKNNIQFIKWLEEFIKTFNFEGLIDRIIIEVDSRYDHCLVPKEEMEKLGFKLLACSKEALIYAEKYEVYTHDYVKIIELK